MQTTATATTQITIAAGAYVRGPLGLVCRVRHDLTVQATPHTYSGHVVAYSFERGDDPYDVEVRYVVQPSPEPTPATPATTRRQSREGQRNAKAELAYQGISDLGSIDPRNSALEGFSVPSLSEPGVRRTVAHDMASDRYHCDCTHGQYGGRGECYHILATRRRVDERRAQWQAAYERDQRTSTGYNDTLNLMYGVQPTSEW